MHTIDEVITGLECFTTRQHKCRNCPCNPHPGAIWIYGCIEGQTMLVEEAKKAIRTGERWRPFVKLEPSDEIKAVHPDCCYVMEDPPDDEQEILVSNGKVVWVDTFYNDGFGCRLDSDHELDGCAWMPMPDPVWEGRE